jgi:hypothetical protein
MKDGQKIGQWLKWDFEKNGNLKINDWNGNNIYFEASNGFWEKREWDSQGRLIYTEDCSGFWEKFEYDDENNCIFYENRNGVIIDERFPTVILHNGRKYQLIP